MQDWIHPELIVNKPLKVYTISRTMFIELIKYNVDMVIHQWSLSSIWGLGSDIGLRTYPSCETVFCRSWWVGETPSAICCPSERPLKAFKPKKLWTIKRRGLAVVKAFKDFTTTNPLLVVHNFFVLSKWCLLLALVRCQSIVVFETVGLCNFNNDLWLTDKSNLHGISSIILKLNCLVLMFFSSNESDDFIAKSI